MRINHLEIAGFGPYKDVQSVDFDKFASNGIFLISGKTGAGKSSILDAICFALYNAVPRYEGTQSQLRSHYCDDDDPSYVSLEFTVGEHRYRVHRAPEYQRPAKRGGGTVTQKSTAELFIQKDGNWEGLAARAVDVAHDLVRILGLSKDQFLQVILLAQNRFQEFLLAGNDERQGILQTLFGTKRFAFYEKAIVERSKALEAQLGEAKEQRDRDVQRARDLTGNEEELEQVVDLAWFTRGFEVLTGDLEAAAANVAAAEVVVAEAALAHQTQLDTRSRQARRDAAREALTALQAESEAITEATLKVQAAVKADAVAPYLEAKRSAAQKLTIAFSAEENARDTFTPHGDRGANASVLAKFSDEQSRTLGALEEAIRDEAALPTLAADIHRCEELTRQLDEQMADGVARGTVLPGLIKDCAEQLTRAQVQAGRVAEAEASLERITAATNAATDAEALTPKLQAAHSHELEMSVAHTKASQFLEELFARRLHGHAGELAGQLVGGEACSVCGSLEHPSPAQASAEPVTEASIAAAREALDEWRAGMELATIAANELKEQKTAALAKAGGKSADDLAVELLAAKVALNIAATAAAEVPGLETQLASLGAEQEQIETDQATFRASLNEAQTELVLATNQRKALEARLARHRGDYDTVSLRADALRASIAAATTLHAAISERVASASTLETAAKTLNAKLVKHGFSEADAGEGEVVGARMSAAEQEAIGDRIRTHQQREAIATATLAEPALQDLPDNMVEIEGAMAALTEARNSVAAANSVRGSIDQRRGQYETLLSQVRTRFADTDALSAEYEEIAGLAAAVQGNGANNKRMRLETYVLAAKLEEIVAAANGRLLAMTSSRYELQHDDSVQYRKARSGLGLAILDNHTGRARATHSLSGGETFLASLALALGLADVVTSQSGGITLDTLFVDEGFGSLDGDTLEIAMSTLDSLRAGGRAIGLISHVDTMKEQIGAKLVIRVAAGGWSEIVQESLDV